MIIIHQNSRNKYGKYVNDNNIYNKSINTIIISGIKCKLSKKVI